MLAGILGMLSAVMLTTANHVPDDPAGRDAATQESAAAAREGRGALHSDALRSEVDEQSTDEQGAAESDPGLDAKEQADPSVVNDPVAIDHVRRLELGRLQRDIIFQESAVNTARASGSLREEADALVRLALLEACQEAARTSALLLLRESAKKPAWIRDGRVVLGSSVEVPGTDEKLTTYYELPFDRYPRLGDAIEYQREISGSELAQAVESFNRLPLDERSAWIADAENAAARLQEARKTGDESDFDVRTWSPRGWLPTAVVDKNAHLLRMPERSDR